MSDLVRRLEKLAKKKKEITLGRKIKSREVSRGGILPVPYIGCSYYSAIVTTGPDRGQMWFSVEEHPAGAHVRKPAFSEDEKFVVTTTNGGPANLWRLPTWPPAEPGSRDSGG